MESLILIAYAIWAFFAGWKFVTNRIPSLNQKDASHIILKIIVSYIIGIFYGGIYIIILLLRFLGIMSK